jgi:hypothetical protein
MPVHNDEMAERIVRRLGKLYGNAKSASGSDAGIGGGTWAVAESLALAKAAPIRPT